MSLSERCFRALWEKDKDKTRHKTAQSVALIKKTKHTIISYLPKASETLGNKIYRNNTEASL